jgi:hypothetical protein
VRGTPRANSASAATWVQLARARPLPLPHSPGAAVHGETRHIRKQGRDFRCRSRRAEREHTPAARSDAQEPAGNRGVVDGVAYAEGRNGVCDVDHVMKRGAVAETLLSAGAVMVLLVALVAVDPSVRQELSQRTAQPGWELASAGSRVHALTTVVAQAVHQQSLAHAPLVIFGLAAVILLLLMLRT